MLDQIHASSVTAEAFHPVSTASCHAAANAVATATTTPTTDATITRTRSEGLRDNLTEALAVHEQVGAATALSRSRRPQQS